MFRKCLKYDMRSIARIWWLLAISVLGLSFVGAITLRGVIALTEAERFPLLIVLGALVVFACFFAIIAAIVVVEILLYLRFYKHFFTDEGYLTFTLPVSRRTLLLSKTVNALIWTFAQVLLTVLCVVIILLIAIPHTEPGEILFTLSWGLAFLWGEIGAWMILYAVEILVLMVLSAAFSISLIHFCITMGAMLAKKYKLLAAVGVYYVVNMAVSLISQILMLVFMFLISNWLNIILETSGVAMQGGIIALLLLIGCAMMASLACTMYFIMQTKLERNLNLA